MTECRFDRAAVGILQQALTVELSFNVFALVFLAAGEDLCPGAMEGAVGKFAFVMATVGVGECAGAMKFVFLAVFFNIKSRRLIRIWRSWGLLGVKNRKQESE